MILFPNLDDEVKVYDKRKSTFFSVTGEEPVICTYKKGDVHIREEKINSILK